MGTYDVFLSHSHQDRDWVTDVARRLEDDHGLRVWLDSWVLVPGKPWQQEMATGLQQAQSCAVCLGATTPRAWFEQEIQAALNLQAQNPDYRVIPVLLPTVDDDPDSLVDLFLGLRTWVDFRAGQDPDYAFHLLTHGIRGTRPGRWPPNDRGAHSSKFEEAQRRLIELRRLQTAGGIPQTVVVAYHHKILSSWLGE
jgi:hypothetical protein